VLLCCRVIVGLIEDKWLSLYKKLMIDPVRMMEFAVLEHRVRLALGIIQV
jgi:hypothetical protein